MGRGNGHESGLNLGPHGYLALSEVGMLPLAPQLIESSALWTPSLMVQ